jgi:hypothetical protein
MISAYQQTFHASPVGQLVGVKGAKRFFIEKVFTTGKNQYQCEY